MKKIEMSDWIQYFPFPTVRPQQIEAINFVLNSFINDNKRVALLECPTGVGKSAIAITVSKYFKEKVPRSNSEEKSVFILTTQKILQEQYKKDFPFLANVSSKHNYQCVNRALGITCDMGMTISKIMSKNKIEDHHKYLSTCVYKKDKDAYDNSEINLTNIHFFLSNSKSEKKNTNRKLMIIDECHNIEDIVVNNSSVTITKYFVMDILKLRWPAIDINNVMKFVNWIETQYVPAIIKLVVDIEDKLSYLSGDADILQSNTSTTNMKRVDDYNRKIESIKNCIDGFDEKQWVLTLNETEDIAELKPIYANRYTNGMLFNKANKILLMSGTILDKDIYCKNVGIENSEVSFLSTDSPFHIDNRPIYYMPVGSMGRKNINMTLPNMIISIKEILKQYPDKKGIIHLNSYQTAEYLYKEIKDDRLLFHSSDDRMDILDFHRTSKSPTVLVSPSFSEGIDLIGELSRFQVIIKCMFPFMGDNYVRVKMKRIDRWYDWHTIRSIVQATGRSVRDESDFCDTYILDSDFGWFFDKNEVLFPNWWKKALNK